MAAPLTLFRHAVQAALRRDPILQRLLQREGVWNPESIMYRMAREQVAVPGITFFDYGLHPDDLVPLHRRTMQVDLWAETLDACEELAVRVEQVLDAAMPFTEALYVASLGKISDRDNLVVEAFVSRKTLTFDVLAYERAQTGLVGTTAVGITVTEPAL